MNIFLPTLNQLAFLFSFIVIGYILMKAKLLPDNAAGVLSKLENMIFIPALVMGTFIEEFTVEKLSTMWLPLVVSIGILVITIPLSILLPKFITRDRYVQGIYTYGLAFSNFGFMGNAVVKGLYPELFAEYLIFQLPLWVGIYVWGVPCLLIADAGEKQSLGKKLKAFVNPMFIGLFIGIILGLLNVDLPVWLTSLIKVSGDCMSPVAMLLTGMIVSTISLKSAFTNWRTYLVSAIRLLAIPLAFVLVAVLFPALFENNETVYLCALCSLAMPLGLSTIVVPSGLGKDTTEAAGMALVSHLLSCITIPIVFMIALM